MANYCNNTLIFFGKEENLNKVMSLFQNMIGNEKKTGKGQLPDCTLSDDGWFFDTYISEEDVIYYETRWSPNISVVKDIADYYHVSFELDYDESSNYIYGRVSYYSNILLDNCLDYEDFEKIEYDEDKCNYIFENEEYESQQEILDILLNRKIKENSNYIL